MISSAMVQYFNPDEDENDFAHPNRAWFQPVNNQVHPGVRNSFASGQFAAISSGLI
jgi:hypothetical protein